MGEKDEPIWDIFNYGALQIFGALENKTPEQVANDLLEQEKEMRDNKLKERRTRCQ